MRQHEVANLERIREAASRPSQTSSKRFWIGAGILAIVAVFGVVAYGLQVLNGLGIAGYSDSTFWGIYEANLVSFIAVSYGGALVSAILRLTQAKWRAPITRLAEATALCSLLVGMTFGMIHVGRPERLWELILSPNLSSPVVWDFVVIGTYLLATAIFLYLPLIPDLAILRDRLGKGPMGENKGFRLSIYRKLSLGWQWLPQQRRFLEGGITTVAILIIPLAVMVHSVLSYAFSLTGRPGWSSTIYAPYFVIAALYAGVGMVILVVASFRKGYRLQDHIGLKHFKYLAYIMLTLDLAYLYFTFTEMLTEGYAANLEMAPILESLISGEYAPFFWLFIVGAGFIPLLLIAIKRTRTINGIVVASALVVAGMWLKRFIIVAPAVTHPLIGEGDWGVYNFTWVPIAVTLAAAAAIPLLLMMFFKVFPILSIDEMEEAVSEESRIAKIERQLALEKGGSS